MSFGYSVDKKIIDVLNEKKFTISAEVIPPRNGEDQQKTMDKLGQIIESDLDFLSVTKGAGGSLRGGSLPISQAIKDHFNKPCIAHFTCRDLVPQEIESHLVDHHYFGIRNILALRGDPPMGETDWEPREGGYAYAHQLIKQIKSLNNGEFLKRDGFKSEVKEKTDFCIGAAVYPEHPTVGERFEYARLKFEAGAEYGITQMLFDPEVYDSFLLGMHRAGISEPILPGIRILKSQKQANVMESRFGCRVPDWYMKALPKEKTDPVNENQVLEPFYLLIDKLKTYGAPGVHLFVLSDIALSSKAMSHLVKE